MKPLRAIVAEDEPLMRQHMCGLLPRLSTPVEVVAEASDGNEAVALTERWRPDVLFLDIQMPGLDGFGVLEALMLGGEALPEVIFTTAYDRYALRAFETNAAHYLLKPISAEKLSEACERVAARLVQRAPVAIEGGGPLPSEEQWRGLLASVAAQAPAAPGPKLAALTARQGEQRIVLPLADILHISADGGLNFIHTATSRHLVDFTLDDLEKRLDPERFLRIHRSHLVNVAHIKALVPWVDGKFEVVMNDAAGTRLSLSRYRLAEMRARLLW